MITTPSLFGVCVVIQRADDPYVVLASKRRNGSGFGLPGGKPEHGETLAQAAARELREETGLQVRSEALVPTYTGSLDEPDRGRGQAACFFGAHAAPSGFVPRPQAGEPEAVWARWEDLFDGPFGDYTSGCSRS